MDISKHVEYIKQRLACAGSKSCFLAVYEDDESLSYFRPSERWKSNAEHTEFVNKVAAALRADGITVEVKTLNTSAYWRWLAQKGYKDGEERRAEFVLENE